MTEKDLLELKEEIEEAKQKVSELKGEKQALLKQLKENWKCSSIEDAEKKLVKLGEQEEQLSNQIETGIEELEEMLNSSE
jgi:septal ring factor EnvC (AmiA/AmiB activator)